MRFVCIIPARGGSRRVPRKNIRSFHGKPIIAYSIQTALDSDLFGDVLVKLDDRQSKLALAEADASLELAKARRLDLTRDRSSPLSDIWFRKIHTVPGPRRACTKAQGQVQV